MENKRALLTLFGGRAFLPIALLVLHEKPALVVPISSEQSQRHLPQLQQAIRKFQTGSEIQSRFEAPKHIDAFEVQEIQDLCEKVIAQYPDMEWIVDITSGTSLMSLGAYRNVAKRKLHLSNAGTSTPLALGLSHSLVSHKMIVSSI